MTKRGSTAALLDTYMDQERLYSVEGRKGLENLCQIAGALGYKNSQRLLQLSQKATVGDLLDMLEDNGGLITAMIEWIRSSNSPEFREALAKAVSAEDEGERDGDDEEDVE